MNKIDRQIEALKWQLDHDTSERDREIHKQALQILQNIKNGKCTSNVIHVRR
ncbi:hypothetical protein [Thermoanaerobacterium thermosaccharolyticum]|uniref:hypothetical protein n=1 Tax=Thermoanaerobacterium thermosaccharolyticum TaxID=1517 RepID=UPI001681AE24|nr:hypothetical protein [Thermoanaerobacterium thermosaccharolyticum]MCP2240205.1 hypothetical protein [Thermoanaerobacterium thermosaccharolyticum]